MSSKRHIRRKQCAGKFRYPTQASADSAARYESGRNQRQQLPQHNIHCTLNSYACRWCGGFHIGHLPTARRLTRRAQFP
jgi:hypothetical protein